MTAWLDSSLFVIVRTKLLVHNFVFFAVVRENFASTNIAPNSPSRYKCNIAPNSPGRYKRNIYFNLQKTHFPRP